MNHQVKRKRSESGHRRRLSLNYRMLRAQRLVLPLRLVDARRARLPKWQTWSLNPLNWGLAAYRNYRRTVHQGKRGHRKRYTQASVNEYYLQIEPRLYLVDDVAGVYFMMWKRKNVFPTMISSPSHNA